MQVEMLNKEKHALVRSVVPEFALSTVFDKEKKMVVCDVCGAMQANTDTDKRLASHLDGKQHLVRHAHPKRHQPHPCLLIMSTFRAAMWPTRRWWA